MSMAITKEQAFELLKDTIITLKDKGKELRDNPELLKKWQEQKGKVDKFVEKYSDNDKKWIEAEYSKWFKVYLEPEIKKRNLQNMI